MATNPHLLRELTEQTQGLARLAAGLLSDVHGGEDLAQEAVLRALKAPPASASVHGGKAWLRTTVKRLAVDEWRSRGRRLHREKNAARCESIPSSNEIVERAELARFVQGAVDGLPPHYARPIRDHYIGGISVQQIAERDGVSVNTVKAQLRRGKAALRASLDKNGPTETEHWSLTLGPLALPALGARTPAQALALSAHGGSVLAASAIMKKFVLAAVFVALSLLGLKALSGPAQPGNELSPVTPEPSARASLGAASRVASAGAEAPDRTRVALGATDEAKQSAPMTVAHGAVLDTRQNPIEGAIVTWEGTVRIERKENSGAAQRP